MTQKDYEKIAFTLSQSCLLLPARKYRTLCDRFAFMLREDDPLFDRDKFMRACGVGE